jgi:3-isopropylmalate dehydrogenase
MTFKLNMKKIIAVLPGDGVGPEVTEQSVKFLQAVAKKFCHDFSFKEGLIGAIAIDKTGSPLPDETLKLCQKADAILLGAIGDPKYDNDPSAKIRPEQGILALRKELQVYSNVRPIFIYESLISKSPLKEEIVRNVDFIVIRELVSGIYFGKRGMNKDRTEAFDTSTYTKDEITRVAEYAFEVARSRHSERLKGVEESHSTEVLNQDSGGRSLHVGRDDVKGKLTVVDKANVLETSRLWRETVQAMEKDYPEIDVEYMFVDNAAMQIIKRPSAFDVVLTENMFGDILTDEASVITGSLGMLPSASIGAKTALYEPIHGSFPKAAGLNIANPIASMLSAAMMLEYSFGLKKERDVMYNVVRSILDQGFGTKDIATKHVLSTSDLADKIIEAL